LPPLPPRAGLSKIVRRIGRGRAPIAPARPAMVCARLLRGVPAIQATPKCGSRCWTPLFSDAPRLWPNSGAFHGRRLAQSNASQFPATSPHSWRERQSIPSIFALAPYGQGRWISRQSYLIRPPPCAGFLCNAIYLLLLSRDAHATVLFRQQPPAISNSSLISSNAPLWCCTLEDAHRYLFFSCLFLSVCHLKVTKSKNQVDFRAFP